MKMLKKYNFNKIIIICISICLVVLAGCSSDLTNNKDSGANNSNVPDQILLSITSSEKSAASSSRTVSWRTPESMKDSSVYLVEANANGGDDKWAEAREIAGLISTRTPVKKYGKYNHFVAELSGLVPGEYSYVIGPAGGLVSNSDIISESQNFTVQSEDDLLALSKILFFSDVQPESSIDEYKDFSILVENSREKHPDAGIALQVGDIVNQGDSPEEWGAFLNSAQDAFEGLPLLTTPGNHEVSPYVNTEGRKPEYYLEVFAMPENGPVGFEEEYYSIEYGNVHIMSLSSNYLDPSETYSDDEKVAAEIADEIDEWIEKELAETNKPWSIVMMHQPAFPLAGGDSTSAGIKERWLPIFERNNVDLILCGHQHEFMRSWPQKNGEESQDGIVQIMGNSSNKHYDPLSTELPFVAFEAGKIKGYHSITATESELIVEAYNSDGNAIDYWMKSKQ